jgi:hypothetical protein
MITAPQRNTDALKRNGKTQIPDTYSSAKIKAR